MVEKLTTEIAFLSRNREIVAHGRVTGACIHDVEVSPGYRRRGLARSIVEKLIGLGGRYLLVKKENKAAIAMYREFGFFVTFEDDEYYKCELMGASDAL